MRQIIFFGISLIAGSAVFFWVLGHIGWKEVWDAFFAAFDAKRAGSLLGLTMLMLFVGMWRWRVILQSYQEHIGIVQMSKIYLAGFALLYIFPMIPLLAESFRGSLLRSHHQIPFSRGVASVLSERILEVTMSLAVVLVGGAIVLFHWRQPSVPFGGIVLGGMVCGLVIIFLFLYVRMFQSKSIVGMFVRQASSGNGKNAVEEVEAEIFRFFSWNNPYFWKALALSIIRMGVGLARTFLLVIFLAGGTNVSAALGISGSYYLSTFFPVPAGIGFHESFQAFTFQVFGFTSVMGAAFALALRAVETLVVVCGLLFVLWFGFDFLHRVIVPRKSRE